MLSCPQGASAASLESLPPCSGNGMFCSGQFREAEERTDKWGDAVKANYCNRL